MDDPGDLVTAADLPQCALVGHVGLLDEDPGALVGRDQPVRAGGTALDQDAGLAQVEQRPGDMGADEPQAASDQDHYLLPL